jgi:hypothetical protein
VNVCLFSNGLFKIWFLTKRHDSDIFFHTVILKVQTFVTMCYQWMYAFSVEFRALRMEPLCASYTSALVWELWSPRCFFRGPERRKSLGDKSRLYGGCWKHSHRNCCNVTAVGLCGVLRCRAQAHVWTEDMVAFGAWPPVNVAELHSRFQHWLFFHVPWSPQAELPQNPRTRYSLLCDQRVTLSTF